VSLVLRFRSNRIRCGVNKCWREAVNRRSVARYHPSITPVLPRSIGLRQRLVGNWLKTPLFLRSGPQRIPGRVRGHSCCLACYRLTPNTFGLGFPSPGLPACAKHADRRPPSPQGEGFQTASDLRYHAGAVRSVISVLAYLSPERCVGDGNQYTTPRCSTTISVLSSPSKSATCSANAANILQTFCSPDGQGAASHCQLPGTMPIPPGSV